MIVGKGEEGGGEEREGMIWGWVSSGGGFVH